MTTERAIELLRRISDSQFDGIHGDERREALSMAVRALEGDGDMISRQAVMKEFSDFVRKSNNSDFAPTPTWNDAVSLVGSMPSAQPETHDKHTETHACDLISRQQAIDAVKDLPNCRNGFSDTYDKACIIGVIDEQQPVDAVPVVRCKDCKHRYIENMTWHCPFGLMGGEDFFCGYGSLGRAERRSDE